MGLFKQKLLWIGIVVVLLVLSIFGLAMMGSIVGAKPKELPVAIAVLDQPVKLPNGSTLAAGEMVKEKLLGNGQMPVRWIVETSEAAVREGLDEQKYYGALVLPADLSAGLLSLSSATPKPATVQILVNEGMSTPASTAVSQMLQQVMAGVGTGFSQQLLSMAGGNSPTIPVVAATAMLTPIQTQVQLVHPIGANQASGNAPGLLTQIIWIGSLVTAAFLFLAGGQAAAQGAGRFGIAASQLVSGVAVLGLVSGFTVWMASGWYGVTLADAAAVWMFLWLIGAAFFLLQSALLNWIGLPAMALLVLLMFFSMPVLNMPVEFLPQATQDWLYSWSPLRIAASGLRNVLYYGGAQPLASNGAILGWIAAGCGLVLLGSGLRPNAGASGTAAGKGSGGLQTQ